MKIELISTVIEELFYNGRKKVDAKLDSRDFMQLTRMANGTVMRRLYYEEKNMGTQNSFFASMVNPREFKLTEADGKGRRTINIVNDKQGEEVDGVMRLPHGLGIWYIRPAGEQESADFARGEIAGEWLYSTKAYEGMPYWIPKGRKIWFYNVDKCVTDVEVDGIWDDDKIDIPSDVAFDIVIQVLGVGLKVIDIPVDKTNNADPNVKMVREKLNTF